MAVYYYDYGKYTPKTGTSFNVWGQGLAKETKEAEVKNVPVKQQQAPSETAGLDTFTRTGEVAQANYVKGWMNATGKVVIEGLDSELLSCIDFEKYPKLKSYLMQDAKQMPDSSAAYTSIAAEFLPFDKKVLDHINLDNTKLVESLMTNSAYAQRMAMPEEYSQIMAEEFSIA